MPASPEVSPKEYLHALRRMVVSADLGAAAVARHCLRTGLQIWPDSWGRDATHPLRVIAVEPSGRDGVVIDLAVPVELRRRFSWAAGQHVGIALDLDGIDVWRTYSICAPPAYLHEAGSIRIAVRKLPGGLVSSRIHQTIEPGRTVDVGLPNGTMTWLPEPTESPLVLLLAGGSGITPLYAVAAEILSRTAGGQVALLLVERSAADVMLSRDLERLQRLHPQRFRYEPIWTSGPAGRPTVEPLRTRIRRLTTEFSHGGLSAVTESYLCGPDGLGDLAEGLLRDAGHPPAAIHRERFTSNRGGRRAQLPRPGGILRVALPNGERDVYLQPGESLLAAMLREGIEHPFSCVSGQCGTCRVRVLEGNVGPDEARVLGPAGEADGSVLACISSCLPTEVRPASQS